jgi:hypothetical protein
MKLTTTDSIESFISLATQGVESLVKAGEMLVRILEEDPSAAEVIREKAPHITEGMLSLFVRIGQHSLRPELLFNSCPAYKRLRYLPMPVQDAMLKNGRVALLGPGGDILQVRITDLTPRQTAQVFSNTGIRSKDEQSAYLRHCSFSAPVPPEIEQPFTTSKGRCVINTPCILTRRDILRILNEIE